MKTKPILFSTTMVQSIQEGRKRQTRRVVKYKKKILNPEIGFSAFTEKGEFSVRGKHENGEFGESFFKMPIQKGDILWVRETWSLVGWDYMEGFVNIQYKDKRVKHFYPDVDGMDDWLGNRIEKFETKGFLSVDPEDEEQFILKGTLWEPSIFMPKWACRIFLKVTNVRVERVQNADWKDLEAEGLETPLSGIDGVQDLENKWKTLWESLYGKESWDANPWVFVYDFEIIEKPENFI